MNSRVGGICLGSLTPGPGGDGSLGIHGRIVGVDAGVAAGEFGKPGIEKGFCAKRKGTNEGSEKDFHECGIGKPRKR